MPRVLLEKLVLGPEVNLIPDEAEPARREGERKGAARKPRNHQWRGLPWGPVVRVSSSSIFGCLPNIDPVLFIASLHPPLLCLLLFR